MASDPGTPASAAIVQFTANPFRIGARTILRLPVDASSALPSRGAVLVEGSINSVPFKTVLEPDGKGSHWFEIDTSMRRSVRAGDTATLTIAPSGSWPELEVPSDLLSALAAAPRARETWTDATPAARWDWIRWIRSTKNPQTRARRIAAAIDKLEKGERRPCCFNRNLCTDPDVSRGGVLQFDAE